MKLTHYLRDQSYDLIEGPVRNQKPLQLWLKRTLEPVDIYYHDLSKVFIGGKTPNLSEHTSLAINSTLQNDYNFNVGLTVLENALKSTGIGDFELGAVLKSGKQISMSYDTALTREATSGEIIDFFAASTIVNNNQSLLDNANRNNILVIGGVVFAKNLVIQVETDFKLDADLVGSLKEIGGGKLNVEIANEKQLTMIASPQAEMPIAVKAYQLFFKRGVFDDLKLITDDKKLF